MLNQQKIETLVASDGMSLDIIEVFHTLQGEGPFTGHPAIFIRLAGCSLQCPKCDTIYTGPLRKTMTLDEIMQLVSEMIFPFPQTSLFVITGGEPFRQNIVPLIDMLLTEYTCHVQVETNGIHTIPHELRKPVGNGELFIVVSPKTSHINTTAAELASVFKYVLSADDMHTDGLPIRALGHKASPHIARPPENFEGDIYVNPCDDKDSEINRSNMLAARDSALRNGYILGLQLHKIVGVD